MASLENKLSKNSDGSNLKFSKKLNEQKDNGDGLKINSDISNLEWNAKNSEYSFISMQDFLEFLKIAHQITDSIENLVPDVLLEKDSSKNEINYNYIANNKLVNDLMLKTLNKPLLDISKTCGDKTESSDSKNAGKNSEINLKNNDRISALIKEKFDEVLSEGLLDSVLPYLLPNSFATTKQVNSAISKFHHPVIKHQKLSELKKSFSAIQLSNIPSSSSNKITSAKNVSLKSTTINDKNGSNVTLNSSHSSKSKSKKLDGSKKIKPANLVKLNEIEIHVYDELKKTKKDFYCSEELLVQNMGYFADATQGQKLEDMDISVHCDIGIFEWLMKWVKRDSLLEDDQPKLSFSNVVPILVSADFLQINPLLEQCLSFCYENLNEIIQTAVNLTCINDSLITRLASMFTNTELEKIHDRKDKILSKLYCKMILALGEPIPQCIRGHWASIANLFKCSNCDKLVTRTESELIPCVPSSMRITSYGEILNEHERDLNWNLSEYITKLFKELKTWRRVYWRLWASCHFLKCYKCFCLFPIHQIGWCCRHLEAPQFFNLDNKKQTTLPVGRYPCCGARAYRFESISNTASGCKFYQHQIEPKTSKDKAILIIFKQHKQIIEEPAPKIMIPERLTSLVARANPESKNSVFENEDVFWWEGIELKPTKQKLGLLSKMEFINRNTNPIQKVKLNPISTSESEVELSTSSDSSTSSSSIEIKKKPRRKRFRKKKRTSAIHARQWSPSLSAQSNLDLQRDFEESAMQQISEYLSKRTGGIQIETNLKHLQKLNSNNINWNQHIVPAGGIYSRLEFEWNEQRKSSNVTQDNNTRTSSSTTKSKYKIYR